MKNRQFNTMKSDHTQTTTAEPPRKKPWYFRGWMKLLYGLVIVAGLSYIGLYQLGKYLVEHPQYASMSVSAFNYTDRPIYNFSIGDSGGFNMSAHSTGGGGLVCCLNLERGQKEVKVEWEVSHSLAQTLAVNPNFKLGYGKPLPRDHWEKTIAIPENLDLMTDYVGVHFLKNGNVKLTFTANKFPDPLPENEREE
ncbi:MAG: DUF3304 domain-containing protein [Methylococcaceae bacterium]|jgi:hypothetical protein